MKIDAAADNGIDVFIFDWYNYNGKPFLNQCLDDGFLNAQNTNKLKFALMWANHDWKDLFPCDESNIQDLEVMYKGSVTAEAFEKIGDEIIEDYFTKPNYWLIEGNAYFSIYDVGKFVEGFGSMEATKTAMEHLDQKAVAAGLKGIHWNLVAWGYPYTGILKNNTPENFKNALQLAKNKLLADKNGPRALTINCWNEWTEGSYLEPDNIHGMLYLEAVKETFKTY